MPRRRQSRASDEGSAASSPDAVALAEKMLQAMQQLTVSRPPPRRPPTFSGDDCECPNQFLERAEKNLRDRQVHEGDFVHETLPLLKGAAGKYIARFNTEYLEWEELQKLLRSKYGSSDVLRNLQLKFFGDIQPSREPVVQFIHRKYLVHRRLFPEKSDEEAAADLRQVLQPELRARVRGFKFSTVAELTDLCEEIEGDLSKAEGPKAERRQQSLLPPCRHCPGKHWHRDCPVIQGQGNWRTAGRNPAPAAGSSQQPLD